jgi:hypothetical protein
MPYALVADLDGRVAVIGAGGRRNAYPQPR